MEIEFKDLLIDIRTSLDRFNKTLSDHDKRIRQTEFKIIEMKTHYKDKMKREKRIWMLLCTACGALAGALINLL